MRDDPESYFLPSQLAQLQVYGELLERVRREMKSQLGTCGMMTRGSSPDHLEFSVKFLPGGEVHALSVPRDTMLEHLAGNPKIEVSVESVESRLRLTLRAGDLSIGEICVDREGRPVTKDDKEEA